MLNLINHEPGIDKTHLYAKDPYRAKYKSTGLKPFNHSKAFIKYSNNMDNIYKNIEKQNPNKKRKILIAFKVVEVLSNKKLNSVVTELIIRGRKLNIYFVFNT